MKRAFVYLSHKKQNGKVLVVEDTLEAFKLEISNVFEIGGDFRLFTENGCEIVDVRVIRDDEKLYVNCGDSKSCDTIESSLAKLSLNRCSEVSDWITLNVGGRYFTTSRSTLQSKEPLSMLARMFADDNNMYLMNPSATDSRGAYLIDRSPEYFEPILNYLRHGEVIIDKYVNPRGVLEEAVFYGKLILKETNFKQYNGFKYNYIVTLYTHIFLLHYKHPLAILANLCREADAITSVC